MSRQKLMEFVPTNWLCVRSCEKYFIRQFSQIDKIFKDTVKFNLICYFIVMLSHGRVPV